MWNMECMLLKCQKNSEAADLFVQLLHLSIRLWVLAWAETDVDPQVGAERPPDSWYELRPSARHDVLRELIGANNLVE